MKCLARAMRGVAALSLLAGASSCSHDSTAPTVVTPPAAVASVAITPPITTIIAGQQVSFTATLRDASANVLTERSVSWTSSNFTIATVSSAGVVRGVAPGGPVTITASSENLSATSSVTVVPAPVASVSLTPGNATLDIGASATLVVTLRDAGSVVIPPTGHILTWTSSDPAIATVTQSGVVNGISAGGPVTITATSEGHRATASITVVLPAFSSISIEPTSAAVTIGGQTTLVATLRDSANRPVSSIGRSFAWTSSDPSIVTVTSTGVVTGVALGGPALITVRAENRGFVAVVSVVPDGQFTGATQVVTGAAHTCALTNEQTAFCWGGNSLGAFGNGTTVSSAIPTPGGGSLAFTQLAAGGTRSCGLAANGIVSCWGSGGSSYPFGSVSPQPISNSLTFAQIAAGENHACGLTAAGAAYCWGDNSSGQIGDGTYVSRSGPAPVASGVAFAQIALGSAHTCGLATSGTVYCWGADDAGQIGDGAANDYDAVPDQPSPTEVKGMPAIASLVAGNDHNCAATASGAIYCWGAFQAGTYWSSATPLSGALPFVQTVAGWSFTCGLTSNGAAYCWGWNGYGQLGDGTVTNRTVPTPVAGGHVFVRLAAGGGGHMCGIAADGITYCWGYNGSGQLGDGTFVNRSLPTAVVR